MTLVASAIRRRLHRDADGCAGGTACTLGGTVKAPDGDLPAQFRWGTDRVSRELLARAWAMGPEATRRSIEHSRRPTWPRRAPATTAIPASGATTRFPSRTGDVLKSRLRERANTARGAAHFLRETVGRVRYPGPTRLTLRADSGFYTHGVLSVAARWMSLLQPSATKSLRNLIEAIGILDSHSLLWTAPPMWPRPPALMVNLTPHRCGSCPACEAHARFPVALASYSFTASSPPRGDARTGGMPPRRDRECIRDSSTVNGEPSPLGPLAANAAWLAVQ